MQDSGGRSNTERMRRSAISLQALPDWTRSHPIIHCFTLASYVSVYQRRNEQIIQPRLQCWINSLFAHRIPVGITFRTYTCLSVYSIFQNPFPRADCVLRLDCGCAGSVNTRGPPEKPDR